MLCTLSRLIMKRPSNTGISRFIMQTAVRASGKYGDEQYMYISSVIEGENVDWSYTKNNILSKRGHVNIKNVDGVLLKLLTNKKKFDTALSFVDYLKSNSQEQSLGSINGHLTLYCQLAKSTKLTEEQKLFILSTYENLYKTYKILDCSTSECLLHALCAIDEWEKAIKVLEDIYISGVPSHSAYSTLIFTLFKSNKKKLAMEYIQRSILSKRPLLDDAYNGWIDYIVRKYKNKNTIVKYLDEICTHVAMTCTMIPYNSAKRLEQLYSDLGWTARTTKIIKTNGQCVCCKEKLDCLKLTEDEFESLQKTVREKLIVGSDLFLKTSPDELKHFLAFIERTAPYDVVLDALNISYAISRDCRLQRMEALNYVVNYFVEKKMKILLLGRKHMIRWNKRIMDDIITKTKTFFTDNLSQDDPFFITAAIVSGAHTDLVSKDLLRGHRYQLQDEKLRLLFLRWQWQHQWMVFRDRSGQPTIQPPLSFTPYAQMKENRWHLPYQSEEAVEKNFVNDGTPDLSSWLCIRPKLLKINELL